MASETLTGQTGTPLVPVHHEDQLAATHAVLLSHELLDRIGELIDPLMVDWLSPLIFSHWLSYT